MASDHPGYRRTLIAISELAQDLADELHEFSERTDPESPTRRQERFAESFDVIDGAVDRLRTAQNILRIELHKLSPGPRWEKPSVVADTPPPTIWERATGAIPLVAIIIGLAVAAINMWSR